MYACTSALQSTRHTPHCALSIVCRCFEPVKLAVVFKSNRTGAAPTTMFGVSTNDSERTCSLVAVEVRARHEQRVLVAPVAFFSPCLAYLCAVAPNLSAQMQWGSEPAGKSVLDKVSLFVPYAYNREKEDWRRTQAETFKKSGFANLFMCVRSSSSLRSHWPCWGGRGDVQDFGRRYTTTPPPPALEACALL